MEQAEDRIAVAHGVAEIIFVDAEEAGDGREDLHADAVERVVKLEHRRLEVGDLDRPHVRRHDGGERVSLGQIAADVPEFLEVVRRVALGGFDPERGVAARAAGAGDGVAALNLFGEDEERLGLGLGAIDQRLRDAVVGDDREAGIAEAAAEFVGETGRVAVGVGQAQGGDLVVHYQTMPCVASRAAASSRSIASAGVAATSSCARRAGDRKPDAVTWSRKPVIPLQKPATSTRQNGLEW